MGLLQKLKSVFGLNGVEPSGNRSTGDVDVTVEREPSTDDEDAVKGTDTATSDAEATVQTDSPISEAEPEPAAEPAVEEADDEPPASEGSDDPVTELNGIGPAYEERLSNLGIETVAELADADADEIEAETDLSAKRVAGWIDQAAEY